MSLRTYTAKQIVPVQDRVLVKGMDFGERVTTSGVILVNDNGKSTGIRPRWAEVHAVGPKQAEIKVGQWILVAHGRWTRGVNMVLDGHEMEIRMVDNNDILMVSDSPQTDESLSTALSAHSDSHRIEGSLHRDGTSEV